MRKRQNYNIGNSRLASNLLYISESAKSKANVRKSDRRFVISGAEIMFKVLGTRSDGLKEDSQPCVGGEREQEKEGRKRERERGLEPKQVSGKG